MCRLRNIPMRDYQESVTTAQTHTDGRTDRQTPDKVIPMCRYASQATQEIVFLSDCKNLGAIPIVPLLYKTGKIGVGQSGFWVVRGHRN